MRVVFDLGQVGPQTGSKLDLCQTIGCPKDRFQKLVPIDRGWYHDAMKEHTKNQPKSPVNTGKLLWLLIGLPVLVVLLLVAFWLLFEHTRQPSAETTFRQPGLEPVYATLTVHRPPFGHQLNESTEQTT